VNEGISLTELSDDIARICGDDTETDD
jgi:hypothetical protein